jgi:hypothetical protein
MIPEPVSRGGNRVVYDGSSQTGLQDPRVVIAYVVVPSNPLCVSHAGHFFSTYKNFFAGVSHSLVIICNGEIPQKLRPILDEPWHGLLERENDDGWDISGYIDCAKQIPSDVQVCLGESVYFQRNGWLARIIDSYKTTGDGIYGMFASNFPRPHLNTTAFAVSSKYLREQVPPRNRAERYEFEHGQHSFWTHVRSRGGTAKLVTWDGCYDPQDWRKPPEILWRGSQTNCLVKCNHTDKYDGATPANRKAWSSMADYIKR